MRAVLDTHALIWWLLGDTRLPVAARSAIARSDNEIFVSAASAWEISIKHQQGKLPEAAVLVGNLEDIIRQRGFTGLPISFRHGESAGSLPLHHKDPFDRMLIAQSLTESLPLISNERIFDRYGVNRFW